MKKIFALLVAFALGISTFSPQLTLGQSESGLTNGKFRRVQKALPDQYIVAFKDSVARSSIAAKAQELASVHGGELKFTYEHALKGFAIRLPEAAAIALSKNPQVAYVEEESLNTIAQQQFLNPGPNTFFGIDRIDQRDLPLDNIYHAQGGGGFFGPYAYILDTGLLFGHQFHPEFVSSSVARAAIAHDTFGGDGIDRNNHGSAVAGIIGGNTYGVAKAVFIRAVKVCTDSGSCPTSNTIAGLDWVIANRVNPAVVNMSLGGPASSAIDSAVRNTIASGVLVVVSAGNDSADASNFSPARVVEALTVGATLNNDARAGYSNFGSVVDLFAPGGENPSQGIPTIGANGSEIRFDGTSAAAPHATGVAITYLSVNTSASPYIVGGELRKNSTPNKVTNLPNPTGTTDNLLFSNFPLSVEHISGTVPVYRYWNRTNTDHYYTTDWNELGSGSGGYEFEQVEFYMSLTEQTGTTPLYRYWRSQIGDHFYTANFGELGFGGGGYVYEGIVGYVYPTQQFGTVPLHRYWNSQIGDHFYTTNFDELSGGRDGYAYEGIACYVSP